MDFNRAGIIYRSSEFDLLENEFEVNQIHLWCADENCIVKGQFYENLWSLLSDEEKTKSVTFIFEKDRHQYVITRAMIRLLLSHYYPKIDPKNWRFDKNFYGKPYVTNPEICKAFRFNISHTTGLIVIAVSMQCDIGIDVECLNRKGNDLDIARYYFSKKEYEELNALPKHEKRDRFIQLWTLKEAYIKAKGIGLSLALDSFSYRFQNDGKVTIEFDQAQSEDNPSNWRFLRLKLDQNHMIALASHNENYRTNAQWEVQFKSVNLNSAYEIHAMF
jgi:4'-phosphopantetheinyl transferase